MEFLLAWMLFASVQLAATMSPGPAFVMAVRNSMAHDRKIGILTALGLAIGVMAHVVFVIAGLSYLIAKSVFILNFIKYAGAAYLIYIGIKGLKSIKRNDSTIKSEVKLDKEITIIKAISMGFLTNLLNPKAVVFFTAVYSQFIDVSTPLFMQISYGVTSIMVEFLWFSGVAIVLTNPLIKSKFMSVVHVVERICGGLMIALGLKLALSK